MADYRPPVPVKVRTARKQHICNDCGQPIEPGDKYELCSAPPWRGNNETPFWAAWRTRQELHEDWDGSMAMEPLPNWQARAVVAALREAGFTVTAPGDGYFASFVEFAVAWGGDDPNDCAGKLTYDDAAGAAEMTQWFDGGYVARRTVTCSRWERVEGTPF